jgi:transcriptional regulator with XRE-family HTH domain
LAIGLLLGGPDGFSIRIRAVMLARYRALSYPACRDGFPARTRMTIAVLSGGAISDLVARAGITRKDFARLLGVHRDTLYEWETEHHHTTGKPYRGHASASALLLSWLLSLDDARLHQTVKDFFAWEEKEGESLARAKILSRYYRNARKTG